MHNSLFISSIDFENWGFSAEKEDGRDWDVWDAITHLKIACHAKISLFYENVDFIVSPYFYAMMEKCA